MFTLETIQVLYIHGLNLVFFGSTKALKEKERSYIHAYESLGEEPPKMSYHIAEKCYEKIDA